LNLFAVITAGACDDCAPNEGVASAPTPADAAATPCFSSLRRESPGVLLAMMVELLKQ
jgi:hypothetical protein